MKILFVDAKLPTFDRASADLRMFTVVRLLAAQGHSCIYCAYNASSQRRDLGDTEVARYREALEQEEVMVCLCGLKRVLESRRFDMVYFKYFYAAEKNIKSVRVWRPEAIVVVDSVDLVYWRLFAKANLSGSDEAKKEAKEIKSRELETYASADLVVTITDEDDAILKRDLPSVHTYIIPNIHEITKLKRQEREDPSLLFIGTFTHEPNVDAVLYFNREIWPYIQAEIPNVRWTIVGPKPPEKIQALASDRIVITGFVPDTLPYLLRTWVSIAPLRFGAGMKGKVGEAMAAGVPVLTTKFGIQGMGVVPGKHLLVAEDPARFADELVRLLKDKTLRDRIGREGQDFIASRYSTEAVNRILQELFGDTGQVPGPKKLPFRMARKVLQQTRTFVDRYFLWRFKV